MSKKKDEDDVWPEDDDEEMFEFEAVKIDRRYCSRCRRMVRTDAD